MAYWSVKRLDSTGSRTICSVLLDDLVIIIMGAAVGGSVTGNGGGSNSDGVGATVVGSTVLAKVGSRVASVGILVGDVDCGALLFGLRVGSLVGRRVGSWDGRRVGCRVVGRRVGSFVGRRRVGSFVGRRVGRKVMGRREGSIVGGLVLPLKILRVSRCIG